MTTAKTRLHITPFSADIVDSVLPPSIFAQAQNLSYHTLQTFPDKGYGYVDLPQSVAVKLKKRLHGAILRGRKMRVEDARPVKRRKGDDVSEEASTLDVKKSEPTAKKITRDNKVIPGRGLSPDRKIKRGWTKAKSDAQALETKGRKTKGDQPSSKYSEKDEVLFRTKIPPNKREEPVQTVKKKIKGDRSTKVVHEFENSTTQPSFLRDQHNNTSKPVSEYVDGTGWVDQNGDVVESTPVRFSRKRDGPLGKSAEGAKPTQRTNGIADDSTSTSGSDSDSEPNAKTSAEISEQDESSPSSKSDGQQDVDNKTPAVHPLEALFKKPRKPSPSSQDKDVAKPSLEVSTAFSFFEATDNDDLEDEPPVPLTPFSSQDMRSRGLRSAAPTPDTAHPSRLNSYERSMSERLSSIPSLEEDELDLETKRGPTNQKQEGEFEKQFWEKRGENDRAWKQRRRETLKERRKADNRAKRKRNW